MRRRGSSQNYRIFRYVLFLICFAIFGCAPAITLKGVTLKPRSSQIPTSHPISPNTLGIVQLDDRRPEEEKGTYNSAADSLAQLGDQIYPEPVVKIVTTYLVEDLGVKAIFRSVRVVEGYSRFRDTFILSGSLEHFDCKIYGASSGTIETWVRMSLELRTESGDLVFRRPFEKKKSQPWECFFDVDAIFSKAASLLQSTLDDVSDDLSVVLARHMEETHIPQQTASSRTDQQFLTRPNLAHSAFGKRWAVVIGISNYRDSRIPTLRYAARDANTFCRWLISPSGGKYAPTQVKLLIDQQATATRIKDALFSWLKQALEEDVVTIYFAGHGSPESPDSPNNLYFLPYDAKYDSIVTTGFPMWDIDTAMRRFIKAKKVVVIADACHSGGVGQPFDIARRENRAIQVNSISKGFENLSRIGEGVCVISASGEKQLSQESKDWGGGHGVFTYFLLQALTGEADYNRDKLVTLGELIPYLSEQVRRATKSAQSPTVAGKFDPALSIGR